MASLNRGSHFSHTYTILYLSYCVYLNLMQKKREEEEEEAKRIPTLPVPRDK